MSKQSAGLVIYRRRSRKSDQVEVFLVHPGGPFWANKDDYAWSVPKGEYQEDEDPLTAAKREFEEEVGQKAPTGDYLVLGEVKLKSGKLVKAWAIEQDIGQPAINSNTFSIEWPPKSGRQQEFVEVDKADWFDMDTASRKLHPGLHHFLERLAAALKVDFHSQNDDSVAGKLNAKQTSLL